jgi:hypothetical protein
MESEVLERLRGRLFSRLIEKRVFHKFRFLKDLFCIGFDATGAYNWGATPPESIRPFALKKEYKKETEKESKKESRKKSKKKLKEESKEESKQEPKEELKKETKKETGGGKES